MPVREQKALILLHVRTLTNNEMDRDRQGTAWLFVSSDKRGLSLSVWADLFRFRAGGTQEAWVRKVSNPRQKQRNGDIKAIRLTLFIGSVFLEKTCRTSFNFSPLNEQQ